MKNAQQKYQDKNKVIDQCDDLFDSNEEFVKELELKLNTALENIALISKKVHEVSPLSNPSHAG